MINYLADRLTSTNQFKIPVSSENRLIAKNAPDSVGSELLRTLGSRMCQAQARHRLKKLLITSAVQGEGKSTVAANLAITLATLEKRVLLVDGDLRQCTLSKWFGIVGEPHLEMSSDIDIFRTPLVHKAEGLSLWVLPTRKPIDGAGSIVQSAAIADALGAFEHDFDWILIDSPPVIPFGDAGAFAATADAVLLVTRRGVTPMNLLEETFRVLDKTKIIATVLNGADSRRLKYTTITTPRVN
jgi:Mrp family chromosome partitioning ATPase